jgi:hypothetical protein
LAAQAAIKHFRHFCEGRLFQLWTDHKPLVTALSRVSTPISPRQQHHLVFISEFNVQLLYLPGLKNVVADFLSRPPPPLSTGTVAATAVADPVDFEEMAAEQNRCPEAQHLLGGTSLASRHIISSKFVWHGLSSDASVFLIYMLIWWAHCSTVIILIIFLTLLIAHPNGWKPSLFQKRLRRHAQKL